MPELPSVYDPSAVEDRLYDFWEKNGYFHAEPDDEGEPFSVVIPPPNVTDKLHIGHALDNTLQDILVRWRRMQGYNTVWIPGTDHAGIATQVRVEAMLRENGKTKHDLGRERFLEEVWKWKEEYGNRIISQLKRLGSSCDWERERFTLDERCSRAVREVFVDLYEKGLIYRGYYITNWCPECYTALSDIEVEHSEESGHLYYLKYPFTDRDGYITVATTRPETMLGDTAVAVNPDDDRYRDLVGETVILPLMNREIPIIADHFVDPKFGTGMVKVTPAHDPNDFEMGQRHDLEQISVIDENARMTGAAGEYAGLDRYECRERVVEDLRARGLVLKVEEYSHSVGHCYRCDTAIEPLLSRQWFVKMKALAGPAMEAVRNGSMQFIPSRFEKIYLNWMENVRDWCISRQLWWGHRIPVWYCQDCGEVIVAREDPDQCRSCGSGELKQDPDVLDTWFSSALWPFSTMGWPEQTPELERYYPTSVLVTAFDIIFFWVARMMCMGLEFMDDVPFRQVLIHGLVRAPDGRKMSKSLGNGVDPLEVIDEYGTDALRFSLVTGTAPGNDTRYQPEKVEASRNFANKVWNASRFALMNLEDFDPGEDGSLEAVDLSQASLPDRWILSRLHGIVNEVTRLLERLDPGEAARRLYNFIWGEFCDWYIELAKPTLYDDGDTDARRRTQHVLWYVLRSTLKLLHPFMPFITEEIWQHLSGEQDSALVVSRWPEVPDRFADRAVEDQMSSIMEVVRAMRNIRGEKKVSPGKKVPAIIRAGRDKRAVLVSNRMYLETLADLSKLEIIDSDADTPEQSISAVAGGCEVYLPLAGLVDIDKETQRLKSELEDVQGQIRKCEAKLANKNFVTRAPAEVVERERKRLAGFQDKARKLEDNLAELQAC